MATPRSATIDVVVIVSSQGCWGAIPWAVWDLLSIMVGDLVLYAVLNSAAPKGRVGSSPTPGTRFANVSVAVEAVVAVDAGK